MSSLYHYTARTSDGGLVRGSMEAESVERLLESLRTRALFVTAVGSERNRIAGTLAAMRLPGSGHTAALAFFRSFAMLIRSGVSMQRSLNVTIERCDDRRLREALRAVLADVENGVSLSAAMARRPREFSALQIAMIRAGEAGGVIDDVLERLAALLEKERALRKKVQGALAYPIVVLCAALVLVFFLLAKIVPMFADMFESFHAELPAATKLLIALGNALSLPALWIGGPVVLVTLAVTLREAAKTPWGARGLDTVRLHLPYVGGLLRKVVTARVARILGALLRSGVALLTAIEVAMPVAGSPLFAAALRNVHGALREGDSLSGPLREARLFDPLFVALVSVGEETGAVDEMMTKVADYFDGDVDAAVATVGAVIEPLLVVFLGGVVGAIVLSIFLPLYSLIGSINR
jgi:type IV pilus assembly protein PilC